ncbi:metallophosphoesterase [Methylobacterium platani]|uniref:Metallophosphoesterase n=2 Tax=Methylobacterium platani TaxID=427683 RepID=A0A179SC04_9HYPH|nr:metallophosphoesterase [Methylobacterium platani]KMO14758.1 metallophosphoesterase [Methylobacterium platani JCM 14648]OAS23902.1 metallophosphoesterase [Methylobacterium platani]
MTKTKRDHFNGTTTWFSADTHFGHRGILKMEGRPFATIEEHDDSLIHAWNSRVRPQHDVFLLGDFAMNSSAARCQEVFARLNGKKHLIIGNHDKDRHLSLGWASEPADLRTVHVDGVAIVMCHYGLRTWNGTWRGALHLYGHSHGKLVGTSRSLDVGVDAWGYRPVGLTEIRERMAETPETDEECRIAEEAAKAEREAGEA